MSKNLYCMGCKIDPCYVALFGHIPCIPHLPFFLALSRACLVFRMAVGLVYPGQHVCQVVLVRFSMVRIVGSA